ncbi:transcription factor AATF Che-1 protein [Rutstroemia sp. NJR-2017a BBW]|nr:transcription factor AATF Che-1 protein [Rutstroemia sp. NJR-2017a BBW]
MAKAKNLAKQFAELEDPIPKDFDPEEERPAQDSEDESGSESDDGLAGTEHYVEVGTSKLRKAEEVPLGPEYAGSRVSRKQLMDGDDDDVPNSQYESADEGPDGEDIGVEEDMEVDSDEALGESDEEKLKDFVFRGSNKPRKPAEVNGVKKRPTAADFMSDSSEVEGAKLGEEEEDEDEDSDDVANEDEADDTDEDILDVDAQHPEAMDGVQKSSDDEESESENPDQSGEEAGDSEEESEDEASDDDDEDNEDEDARRAELRKIMGEEQKTVVATISQAAKADADKGNAVKQQRKAFDSLLNVRIRLQKTLVATNSLPVAEDKDKVDAEGNPFQAAEEAALKLWNTIDSLRHDLTKATSTAKTGQKRKRDIDSSTPSSTIWDRMQATELTVLNNRQTVLEKWSSKVRATTAVPVSRKLNPTAPQQSITSLLHDTLATSSSHLISRTRVPRSCAPIQARQKLSIAPSIFDDADFYQLLLKELLDQRMVDSSNANNSTAPTAIKQWTAVKEAKTRKNVDTKASKGRKMRFTVHEKLQNFMAPEDRNGWEESARDRFFATLLGRKMDLGEEEGAGSDRDEEDGGNMEEEGLMLFRS